MNYMDAKLVEGFRLAVQEHLGEAVNFAVEFQRNRGEKDEDELRQAAQDALAEMAPAMVDGMEEAFRRSALAGVDWDALALLFKQLAIRAKVKQLASTATEATLYTRRGKLTGIVYGVESHEGQEAVALGVRESDQDGHVATHDEWIPLVAVQEVEVQA